VYNDLVNYMFRKEYCLYWTSDTRRCLTCCNEGPYSFCIYFPKAAIKYCSLYENRHLTLDDKDREHITKKVQLKGGDSGEE
jgi:hypothetical protein